MFADVKSDLSISADRIGFEQAEAFEPAGLCAQPLSRQCRKDFAAGFPVRHFGARRRAFGANAQHQNHWQK